jgi:hypothetical protein
VRRVQIAQAVALALAVLSILIFISAGNPIWKKIGQVSIIVGVLIAGFLLIVSASGAGVENDDPSVDDKTNR